MSRLMRGQLEEIRGKCVNDMRGSDRNLELRKENQVPAFPNLLQIRLALQV